VLDNATEAMEEVYSDTVDILEDTVGLAQSPQYI
jgi:hypothetical protein